MPRAPVRVAPPAAPFAVPFAAALLSAGATIPAHAGETVLYDAAPAWVETAEVPPKTADDKAPLLLLEQQARIETGRLTVYLDTAIALDSPQALTRFGTLTANWLPDKGDLTIHRVELLRDGAVIDVLKDGARFEVLRRERRLESRLVNGALTATLAVPGAKLGDVLRLAYSVTTSDQAMGDNVQWQAQVFAKPFPLREGRIAVSWPEGMAVTTRRFGKAEVPNPVAKNGFMTWSVRGPVAQLDEMPSDAPSRFRLGEMMQVSTYADWAAVSRNHAEHYRTAGTIAPGGDLAARVAAIAAASPDPLTRAALALRMVQDDVSYLANGMAGGNYIPQAPEETWAKRFGDCKAKTLLLVAMLRELGIEAEPALIRTRGGDALPLLAPMPGNFDHVIARAVIGGTNYWLDGTTSGTRRDTIDEVPRFFHALPLREEGAELMPLDTREQSTPDRSLRLVLDHRAGLRVPARFDLTAEYRGAEGAKWRSLADQSTEKMRKSSVSREVNSLIGGAQLVDHAIRYDAETGVAQVTARGIIGSLWKRDGNDYRFEPPAQAVRDFELDTDRARAAWREIPLALSGPSYHVAAAEVLLPGDMAEVKLEGAAAPLTARIAGVELAAQARLESGRLTLEQSMRTREEELAAAAIAPARRELGRFDRQLPVLRSQGPIRELWQYCGEDRARLAELEALYAEAIAEAEPEDATPLVNRARFRAGVYDHAAALGDVEAAIAIESSRELVLQRARLRRETGDLAGALADFTEAEALQPDGTTHEARIDLLAMLGRPAEGVALAEDFDAIAKDRSAAAALMAVALGWNGAAEEGLALIEDMVAQRPADGGLLNALCWQAAIWDRLDPERMEACTKAVEKSDNSPAALDSRALAHFRMGDLAAARADVDAALLAAPWKSESRLLRGIILTATGDKADAAAGKAEIALALKMRPSLAAQYKAWGLAF